MDYALSNADIMEKMDGKCKIVGYDQLHKIQSIDELLNPYGYCVILYLTKENHGHWVAVFNNPRGNVEVFDSYGLFMVDEQQDLIDPRFKSRSNQDQPYLSELIYKSGRKVEYNDHKFQKG